MQWWKEVQVKTAYFNSFILNLPDECVAECSQQGQCDATVAYWASQLTRPAYLTPRALAAELHEYGAWSKEELSDDTANWHRIIWIAACNIKEEQREKNYHGQ